MTRIARVVLPGIPHHVTQRGNHRQPVFFSDDDRRFYLRVLKEEGERAEVEYWAYCLMDNHVHLIVVPRKSDSLARVMAEAHRRYTSIINGREGWVGHLWQGRFASFPLDNTHLYAAIRYVELNPVRAGMAERAQDYPWSSAKSHVLGLTDPLLSAHFLKEEIKDWSEFLKAEDIQSEKADIERHARTGRPLGGISFIQECERKLGRVFRLKRPGRRPDGKNKADEIDTPSLNLSM